MIISLERRNEAYVRNVEQVPAVGKDKVAPHDAERCPVTQARGVHGSDMAGPSRLRYAR